MNGIFTADSAWCTKGVGAKNNNCGNVRPGSGKYGDKDVNWEALNNWRKYNTIEDGIMDNTAIYAQLYEDHSIDYLCKHWAEGSKTWCNTVKQKL